MTVSCFIWDLTMIWCYKVSTRQSRLMFRQQFVQTHDNGIVWKFEFIFCCCCMILLHRDFCMGSKISHLFDL